MSLLTDIDLPPAVTLPQLPLSWHALKIPTQKNPTNLLPKTPIVQYAENSLGQTQIDHIKSARAIGFRDKE